MAKISPLDPLGLTVNPATGPETLGIAYDYDTESLHPLENAQIYSFFEKITDYCTISIGTHKSLGLSIYHYLLIFSNNSS